MNIDNEILNKLDAITEQLSKIISALNRKQNKAENAEGKSRYEVNVEHSKEPTKNPDWNKVRGTFKRPNRKYPDWITVFVNSSEQQNFLPGSKIAVEGNLREGESKTGKPIFSIFAGKIEIIQKAEQPEAEIEQFNTKGNYDEEVPF